jgi:hypothetical protein
MRSDSRFRQVPFRSQNGVLVFQVQDAVATEAAPGSAF